MPGYKITLRFRGGLSPSQRDLFGAAAARIERAIAAPLPAVRVGSDTTTGCIIDAQGVSIDGPGGILGQAGPMSLRPNLPSMGPAAYLPSAGVMSFDSADLAKMQGDGTLVDVLTHEMLHVVGIGTVWKRKGRLLGAGMLNPVFNGVGATREYSTLAHAHAISVPVENMGGPGTRDSHWRERVFANELMTGYVSRPGMPNPISRLTIASLADLGYVVDLAAAESYALPTMLEAAVMEAPVLRPHCLPTIPFADEV